MKTFHAIALTIMAAFFVWLLLQMSRTPEADRRLLMIALAFGGVALAALLGGLLARERSGDEAAGRGRGRGGRRDG